MNPLRFNEPLIELSYDKDVRKGPIEKVLNSPLIVWKEESNDDFVREDYPEAFWPNGCPRLPFENFRVQGFYHYLGDGYMKFRAWIHGEEKDVKGNPTLVVFMMIYEDETKVSVPPTIIMVRMAFFRKSDNAVSYQCEYLMFDVKSRQIFKKEMPKDFLWGGTAEWIGKMCIDFYNPHLYLCKVSPTIPQGHTIAWQKAREHYVLLHKSHEANKKEHAGKRMVFDGALVDRVAHSRRAHYRLLRSPKFKHKQGQRIWIRSAWIGPVEWTDRSGQIYRIIERNNKPNEPTP